MVEHLSVNELYSLQFIIVKTLLCTSTLKKCIQGHEKPRQVSKI